MEMQTVPRPVTEPAWGAIYAITLCVFVLIASEFMPVSLLSPIAHDLDLTAGQAGRAIAISGVFALAASLLITRFVGRTDRRTVLLGMTALLIVSGSLVAFAPTYAVLMAGRAVLGIAIGGFWSMAAALAMRLVPPESVPKAIAVMNGGNAVALVLSPPLGSFVGGLVGWRGAFFCVVPLAVIALVWQAFAVPSLPSEARARGSRLRALLRRRSVVIGLVGVAVFFMGQFALFTYLRPFLEQVTHLSLGELSAMLLLIGVSGFAGTVLIGRAIGPRLRILLAVLPAIMAVVACGLALFGGSLGITAVLLAIWGFTATAAPVGWWTWVTRATPEDPEAGGAWMVAVIQLAITLGATVGGMVFDAFGPVLDFIASAMILGIAALLALASETPRAPDE